MGEQNGAAGERVAIVTGGSRGLGKSMVITLCECSIQDIQATELASALCFPSVNSLRNLS